jgi:hypothetical protein
MLACPSLGTAATNARLKELSMRGSVYPNACTNKQKEEMRRTLDGKINKPSQAFKLIETLLCERPDKSAIAHLRKSMPRQLRVRTESAGQKPESEIVAVDMKLARRLLADGNAWDVSIHGDGPTLALQYFANEACVKGVTFNYVKSTWMIHEISEACD